MASSITACSGSELFACAQSDQCVLDGQLGTCEPDGYCSFPDEACDSGRRYGDLAPAGLASTCVPVDPGSTSTTAPAESTAPPPTTSGAPSTSLPPPDGSTSTPPDSSSGPEPTSSTDTAADSSSGEPNVVLAYTAALTGCNDPINLDPDLCEMLAQPYPGAMTVDLDDRMIGPFHGYLRFDLDDALVPRAVVSVTLRLVATDDTSANGPSSGEVYAVEPFTYEDLFMLQPAPVGMALAPDQGAVDVGQVVEWPLPPDVLADGPTSLYLGVFPLDTNGIDYWGAEGPQPPELLVELLP
ncbi:MAG: hypothetical protein KDK70_16020 [Myxococcales bacterium]|nr:hypothetical protein [Myxococcales bacterium]